MITFFSKNKILFKFFLIQAFFLGSFLVTKSASAATNIYRSVGPNNTTALATGASNTLTISGSTATFASALADKIGVGDVIQYDSDNNGTIDALAFISSRTDSTHYGVQNVSGSSPATTSAGDNDWSIFRAYTSLANAENGTENTGIASGLRNFDTWNGSQKDLVAADQVWNIACYGDAVDTTALEVYGWTADATRYINIYTPTNLTEVGISQRHSGFWDSSKYILSTATGASALKVSTSYTVINGIQFTNSGTASTDNDVELRGYEVNITVKNSIMKNGYNGVIYSASNNSSGGMHVLNNVVYGTNSSGIRLISGSSMPSYVYNNTAYKCNQAALNYRYGIEGSTYDFTKNNISMGNSYGTYMGDIGNASSNQSYNISQDSTAAGTGSMTGKTLNDLAFLSTSSGIENLHIQPTSIAKNAGADLSADPNLPFNTDIDGQTRDASLNAWDIGADEAAIQIFYSVGQNTNDHSTGNGGATCSTTGACTIYMTAGVATLNYAQTATNIGVGDKVTYNTNSVAYIAAKINQSNWKLITTTGATPADISSGSPQVLNSISHAFQYLTGAFPFGEGVSNASHLNTRDFVGGNYQLNIPCYYDGSIDSNPAAGIANFTTSPSNYVRIYTPVNTSTEVNLSQRHQGKWDDSKFTIGFELDLTLNYITAEGLQVKAVNRSGIFSNSPYYGKGQIISDNIIWGSGFTTAKYGIIWTGTASDVSVKNNIIYGFNYAGSYGIKLDQYKQNIIPAVDNNTVYGCATGIFQDSDAYYSNNLSYNNGVDYTGTGKTGSTNNLSKDGTANGTNAKTNQTVLFADAANRDFHLSPTDISAKNAGVDLSADPNFAFTTDIDGQTRSASPGWDIGADEAANNVYYSVGQSNVDLSVGSGGATCSTTGACTIALASGAATLNYAQTGNIGVGDEVVYNTNQKAYIAAKTNTDGMHWTLVTAAGSVPLDTAAVTLNSIKHVFTTLQSAITNSSGVNYINNADLTAANVVLNIPCYYDNAADTTAVTVTGYTTSPANYLKIYTPNSTSTEANYTQRHQGKWDSGKYRIEFTNVNSTDRPLAIYSIFNVKVDGLQIKSSDGGYPIEALYMNYGSASGNWYISNNIVAAGTVTSTGNSSGIRSYDGNNNLFIWNNIVYGYRTQRGGIISNGRAYVYNNTVYDSNWGISRWGSTTVVKNNLIQNCTDGYYGTFDSSSDYNISGLASDAPGTNSKNLTNVTFSDTANKDFHLNPNDTAAKNAGADLSADPNFAFTTDIDGQTRSASPGWDIGADESATAIYYSVGQNTSDHSVGNGGATCSTTGACTIYMTSGIATLNYAQTASNIGVGDKVTYNTSSVAYIAAKIDQSNWKLITATGGMPTDIPSGSPQTLNSISHAFSLLSDALPSGGGGAKDSSHLNTTNLVTSNYQLYIPLYYDTGSENAGQTQIYGWTTSISNYIKIYTPYDTAKEVNQSQRHKGTWDATKYNLNFTASSNYNSAIDVKSSNVKVEGVQIFVNPNSYQGINGILAEYTANPSKIDISNNIIYRTDQADSTGTGISLNSYGSVNGNIYNNLVHGFRTSSGGGNGIGLSNKGYANVYNNTIYNCGKGVNRSSNSVAVIKNNIANNNSIDYSGTFSTYLNNISQDSTSPNSGTTDCGGHSCRSQTVSFADTGNNNFHLSSVDSIAKSSGISLSNDSGVAFSGDIDGQQRSGAWDIGADQFIPVQEQKEITTPANPNSLVAHWTMDGDDVNGNAIKDTSGNSLHATINGGVTQTLGKIGQAVNFDGNDGSYAQVSTDSKLDITSGGLTITGWIKLDSYSSYEAIVNRKATLGSADADTQYRLALGTGWVYYRTNTAGADADMQTQIPTGDWVFFALSHDYSGSGTAKFYKNGSLTYTATVAAPTSQSYPLFIGERNYSTGQFFKGKMDDIRIYNKALSANEISALYNEGRDKIDAPETAKGNTNGLIGYWSFEGPTVNGTTVSDLGGSNNGTITSALPALGKIGQAMSFNSADNGGNGDKITTNTTLSAGSNFTIATWVRVSTNPGGTPYVAAAVNNSWFIFAGWSKFYNGTAWSSDSSKYIADNNWHYLVYTGDGTYIKAYIDGVLDKTDTMANPAATNGIYIGSRAGSLGYNGLIDEFRIYNRALSANEIMGLYNVGQVNVKK